MSEFRELSKYLNTITDPLKEGVKDSFLEKVEKEIGVPFPPVYKKFLQIPGGSSSLNSNLIYDFQSLYETGNKLARERLAAEGLENLIPKEFWVFALSEDGTFFHFFHFDEGEDPPVYGIDIEEYLEEPDVSSHRKITRHFSSYIARLVPRF